MLNNVRKFSADEDGAVTVDWVVLTAGVVALGSIAYWALAEPFRQIDSETGTALSNVSVREITFN
ncbi:MAG: hypothetical protein ACR2O2_12355 [Ruegeria sp.]